MQAPSSINKLFSQSSTHYDRANDFMSLGLHRLWRRALIRTLPIHKNQFWLDVGTGTGDIALHLADQHRAYTPHIYGLDANSCMLSIAKKKALNQGMINIQWDHGYGEALPYKSSVFNGVLMGFSLRNILQWKAALAEALRCTKPQGLITIMEFNARGPYTHGLLFSYYRQYLLEKVGYYASGAKEPYAYLAESIHDFAPPEGIVQALKDCGWSKIRTQALFNGIVLLYKGEKP